MAKTPKKEKAPKSAKQVTVEPVAVEPVAVEPVAVEPATVEPSVEAPITVKRITQETVKAAEPKTVWVSDPSKVKKVLGYRDTLNGTLYLGIAK